MLQVRKFESAYRVCIATLASAITVLASNYFTHVFLHGSSVLPYVLAAVGLIVYMIDLLFESLVNYSQPLRKFIAGNDFIEGYWHDESIDANTGLCIHGVLFQIVNVQGELVLNGVTFDAQGTRIATFRSDRLVYSDRILFYEYVGYTVYGNSPTELGIGQLLFDVPPISYSGFYLSHDGRAKVRATPGGSGQSYPASNVIQRVVGEKVSIEDFEKFNKFTNIDDKRMFVCDILARYTPTKTSGQTQP